MKFNKEKIKNSALIFSWGLYDLANQFFVLNIVSLYFIRWLTLEKKMPELFYSAAFGISNLFIAALGPILGAFSDLSGRRRPFLIYLTLLSVIFTMALGLSENIILVLVFFAIANFGCQAASVFYNALMKNISSQKNIGLVSGIGKMLGYTGAIIALQITKPIVLESGYRATFFPTGIFFLLFALPCMIFIKDTAAKENTAYETGDGSGIPVSLKIRQALTALKATVLNINKFPGLADFLKGSFFGLCAVNTVIVFMSIYATRVFKLDENQVINLISFSTLFAILGSFFSGLLSDRFGHRNCFIAVFFLWVFCFLGGALGRNNVIYWAVGALAGLSLGATWVVSRALAIKLVPREKMGEVFGLFNLIGYIAAIIGSLFWGVIVWALSPLAELGYRIALASQILFILCGIIFLLRIPSKESLNHA